MLLSGLLCAHCCYCKKDANDGTDNYALGIELIEIITLCILFVVVFLVMSGCTASDEINENIYGCC